MKAKMSLPVLRAPYGLMFLLIGLMVLLAACQPAATPAPTLVPTAVPTATEEPVVPVTAEAEISVANDPDLGDILVGNNGMTLYMFTKDEPDKSNCDADCLAAWPPLLTQGSPVLGEGVDPALVGTAELADGSMIVTYNKMPLYYWVNDKAAGETTGQGVGTVWYVVSPAGEVIGMEPAVEEAVINVVDDPTLGQILVGNNDMTLYMFTKDEPDKSNCDADCLAAWPPLLTLGSPTLGEGVDDSLVGSAELADGSMIVTYNGMPLYYWVNDKAAGDTTGQGVGTVWYVVSPAGEVIGMEPADDSSPAAADEAVIDVAEDPTLGQILVGKDGMTLYMFTNDGPNVSNCSGDCLVNWPPLLTKGNPVLGEGVDDSLVGTATLADGTMIVTYNEMPLYYWINDKEAGDTTGQGVGGVWWVVSPEGEIIGM
jgi:predicted lipoprotein with Yx(FWY)xxD motif